MENVNNVPVCAVSLSRSVVNRVICRPFNLVFSQASVHFDQITVGGMSLVCIPLPSPPLISLSLSFSCHIPSLPPQALYFSPSFPFLTSTLEIIATLNHRGEREGWGGKGRKGETDRERQTETEREGGREMRQKQ